MKKIDRREAFIKVWEEAFPAKNMARRSTLKYVAIKAGLKDPIWLVSDPSLKVRRGVYRIPKISELAPIVRKKRIRKLKKNVFAERKIPETTTIPELVVTMSPTVYTSKSNLQPIDPTFIQWGNYEIIDKVITSEYFNPMFITGLSGNGKTMSVIQCCAIHKRPMIRVNVTAETDEDDLLGGFRLINGETVWHNGPVVEAMQTGSILLLDEIDLATRKIMCLQPILEGNGVYLKKINTFINPAAGFNIIATANTKGKGSDDGTFVGTNVLNEAFLDRFPITIEQDYPDEKTEKKILLINIKNGADETLKEFINMLTKWAWTIRKTYDQSAINDVITTRRLVMILRNFAIFGDRVQAIKLCINRFDEDSQKSFMELYEKLDASINPLAESEKEPEVPVPGDNDGEISEEDRKRVPF